MISFTIIADCALSPEQICEGLFNVEQWTGFKGYGPLPGIRKVTKQSPDHTREGTVFHVENTDGSRHREIVETLEPGNRIVMRMEGFSPPLRNLATHFVEHWEFDTTGSQCRLHRRFELHPTNFFATVPLWFISRLLKKAVHKHTQQIVQDV